MLWKRRKDCFEVFIGGWLFGILKETLLPVYCWKILSKKRLRHLPDRERARQQDDIFVSFFENPFSYWRFIQLVRVTVWIHVTGQSTWFDPSDKIRLENIFKAEIWKPRKWYFISFNCRLEQRILGICFSQFPKMTIYLNGQIWSRLDRFISFLTRIFVFAFFLITNNSRRYFFSF